MSIVLIRLIVMIEVLCDNASLIGCSQGRVGFSGQSLGSTKGGEAWCGERQESETNNGEGFYGLNRSCTWPIYILSDFKYSPGLLTYWLNSVDGLPVRHGLLQAPSSSCYRGFWLPNRSEAGYQSLRKNGKLLPWLFRVPVCTDGQSQISRRLDSVAQWA